MSKTAAWPVLLSEVLRQIIPESKSSCNEGSVADDAARPTDYREAHVSAKRSLLGRTSVTRQQLSGKLEEPIHAHLYPLR